MDQSISSLRTDWRQVGLIWAVGLLAAAQFGKVSLAFDLLRQTYARPDPELAFIVSGVGLAGIAFGAVAGMGIARFGARRVLLMAMVAAGLLSVIQSTLPGYGPLIALRVIEGLAHLAIVVSCPVLIAAAAMPKDRAMAMALWASFFGVSFALSAPLIAPLASLEGLGTVFLAHGLAIWVLIPLVWLWVDAAPGEASDWPGFWAAHIRLYQTPTRLAPALTFFWHTLGFVALLTFLPEQITSPLPQAAVAGALPLAALVGIFAAGWLTRWIAPLQLCLVSFLCSAGLILAVALTQGWPQVMLAMLLMISLGVVPGGAFAAIPAFNEARAAQSEANGAMAQLGNIGTSLGTPIYALALTQAGGAGMAGLTILLCGCGALCVFWVQRRLRAA